MKKALCVAAALALLPSVGQAQEFAPLPGWYIGAGAGGVWYLSNTTSIGGSFSSTTGFLADVVAGYDFVGPRVELEVGFGFIPFTATLANTIAKSNFSGNAHQLQVMGKVLYDFIPASKITPYIGGGAGIAFVDGNAFLGNTVFAYEGILGVGTTSTASGASPSTLRRQHKRQRGHQWRERWREQLEYRWHGVRAIQVRTTSPTPGPAAAPWLPLLHGVLRLGQLTPVGGFAERGETGSERVQEQRARITATGHTDTSGPRPTTWRCRCGANAVKDALVREGVPAQAIAVIGRASWPSGQDRRRRARAAEPPRRIDPLSDLISTLQRPGSSPAVSFARHDGTEKPRSGGQPIHSRGSDTRRRPSGGTMVAV